MDKLIYNQAGIFHLQQLEFQFRRKYGERFRLSDEVSRNDLIHRSSESSDRIIRQYFERFCHELAPELIEELVMRGIVTPPEQKH